VAAVREAVPAETAIRLDANGAFGEAEALRALERLAPHGIDFVEQPVAAAEVACLARVRAASPIRVAADEAVTGIAGARALIDARAADVLVLKPPTLGGPAATLAVAALATGTGLEVVVTSLIDSSLGIAAALHCAAALPRSLACGLATAHLLERDLAAGIPVRGGSMALPERAGLGVAPDASAAETCATGPTREISH